MLSPLCSCTACARHMAWLRFCQPWWLLYWLAVTKYGTGLEPGECANWHFSRTSTVHGIVHAHIRSWTFQVTIGDIIYIYYRSDTVNSNTVNSKFHFIQSFCEISVKSFSTISCLNCTVNSNFHLFRSKSLPTNDFELTMPDLYYIAISKRFQNVNAWKLVDNLQQITITD